MCKLWLSIRAQEALDGGPARWSAECEDALAQLRSDPGGGVALATRVRVQIHGRVAVLYEQRPGDGEGQILVLDLRDAREDIRRIGIRACQVVAGVLSAASAFKTLVG
jgi:hypothetical protein